MGKYRGKGKRFGNRNKSKNGEGRWDNKPSGGYWPEIIKENAKFVDYYKFQQILPDESEFDQFMEYNKKPLPTTFRITGSRRHAQKFKSIMEKNYFTSLQNVHLDGEEIEMPKVIPWYPDNLGYHYSLPRSAIKKSPECSKFQEFLVGETEVGNINRQEAVSMIPPLLLDVKPHHAVLDMCAAPGSKTAQLIEAVHADESDGGIPDGLIIANDADFKRAYMLVHQTRRHQSPALIITNHEAQFFPGVVLADGAPLKFDRILADVPCSGDGTIRKNAMIWTKWTNGSALGLHPLQVSIFLRGCQLLKVGGKIVYSTCSLNPIENEAVVSEVLRTCKESMKLLNVSNELPLLKRKPGLKTWKVMNSSGTVYENFDEVPETERKVVKSMFPQKDCEDMGLENCLRIYPHVQDTGGFFVAVFEKVAEVENIANISRRKRSEKTDQEALHRITKKQKIDEGMKPESPAMNTEDATESNATDPDFSAPKESSDDPTTASATVTPPPASTTPPPSTANPNVQRGSSEDPYIFLTSDDKEVESIISFYGLRSDFPIPQLLVRSFNEAHQSMYLTSKKVRETLLGRNSNRIKCINTGVKLFARAHDPTTLSPCRHRFVTEGLHLASAFVGERRIVTITPQDFKMLVSTEYPKFDKLDENFRKQMEVLEYGGCVAKLVAGEELKEEDAIVNFPQFFSLWRGKNSVNLLLNRMERKSWIRRLGLSIPKVWGVIEKHQKQEQVEVEGVNAENVEDESVGNGDAEVEENRDDE